MDRFLEFAANHVLLVAALLGSFFLVVFYELRRKSRGLSAVEAQEAVKLINADALVLDLRSAEAFARGHIVNAKNIPYDELEGKRERIEEYRSRPIVAVCDSGVTSSRAVDGLRKAGFDKVYTLRGGINGWLQANLPLVTARKTGKK